MNKLCRLINIVAALLLLVLAVAVVTVMLGGIPSGKLRFIGLFGGVPFIAHAWTIIASWRQVDTLEVRTAVWGLGLASIAFFTWIVMGTVFLEMMVQNREISSINWQFVVFGAGLFVLPISGFLNLMHFRNRLIAEN